MTSHNAFYKEFNKLHPKLASPQELYSISGLNCPCGLLSQNILDMPLSKLSSKDIIEIPPDKSFKFLFDHIFTWADFIEQTSLVKSSEPTKYICKTNKKMYKSGLTIETLHGMGLSCCQKMSFREVIIVSRICLSWLEENDHINNFNDKNTKGTKKKIIESINRMAFKADAKYKKGWKGIARKIASYINNLFAETKVVKVLDFKDPEEGWMTSYLTCEKYKDKVPYFIGTDASFARYVAKAYS